MIKFKGQLLKFDFEDALGTKFPKDCHIESPKKVPVFFNFNMWNPMDVIGYAKISKEPSGLSCECDILEKHRDFFTEDRYFVGGYYQNVQMHSEAGLKVITSGKLTSMSIVPDGAQVSDELFVERVKE